MLDELMIWFMFLTLTGNIQGAKNVFGHLSHTSCLNAIALDNKLWKQYAAEVSSQYLFNSFLVDVVSFSQVHTLPKTNIKSQNTFLYYLSLQ